MLHSIVFAVAFYATTILFLLFGFWLLVAPRSWAMAGLKAHAKACLWLLEKICGTRLEVRGKEHLPSGPFLVVSKHQSTWDTFALIPLFDDPAVVLKDELKFIPVYGWFCVKFEMIMVKREKAAIALKNLVSAAQAKISQGRQVLIFPEGSRKAAGAPPDYKPGYIAVYEHLDVPAVPLALNSGLYWPRRSIRRFPGTIVVAFQPPVPPGLPRREARKRIEGAIETATNALIAEALAGGTELAPLAGPAPDSIQPA